MLMRDTGSQVQSDWPESRLKTMIKKIILLMIILPVVAIANPMNGEANHIKHHEVPLMHPNMQHKPKPDDVGFFLHDLNLTPAQNSKILMLLEKERDLMEEDREKARQVRRRIQEMALSDDFDKHKLEKLIDQSLVIHKRYALTKAQFSHELFEVLTEQQRQALKLKMLSFNAPFPG